MTTNKNRLTIVNSTFDFFPHGTNIVQRTNTAMAHDLYYTNGYVGPKPSQRPLPVHNYEYYWDHVRGFRQYKRNYPDGTSDTGGGGALSLNPSSPAFTPLLNWDRLYNEALTKLNEQVRGKLDLSVDIAQAGQVKRMFSATKRVEDFTKVFSRKFGLLRAAASLRLEYMYGVKPLISSVFGVADELLRHNINKSQRYRASATDSGYRPDSMTFQAYYGTEIIPAKYCNLNIKMRSTVGVTLSTSNAFEISRFSSLNPVSIAWELMPYSFVVDWFYNVGDYLRNYETAITSGSNFISGYRTDFAAFSGTAFQPFTFTNPPGTDLFDVNFSGARYNRTSLLSYPVPNKPMLQADLGSSRLLNAAALLGNLLGRPTGEEFRGRDHSARDHNRYRNRVNNSINVRYRRK